MEQLNPQAIEANRVIQSHSAPVFEMLSSRGRGIYYPAKGILAQGAAAKGKEINATIGTAYEDNGSPMVLPSIADLLRIDAKEAFPYAPSEGLKALRDKWKDLIRTKNPSLGTNEIGTPVVSCGVTNGLSMIGYMFVNQGDEIILPDLYWENYDLVFANSYGAKFRFFNLFRDGRFDIRSFETAVDSGRTGKKIVLLNFPNNPTGYAPSADESTQIVSVLKAAADAGNNVVAVLDDSYFGLVFENGIVTESLFAELSQTSPRLLAVKADGLTKEEYAWGLRVGFVTYGIQGGTKQLYKALEDKTSGAVRGDISNTSLLSQSLFLHAAGSTDYLREKETNKSKIQERYAKVKATLAGHPEYNRFFEALPFNSGYFMCVVVKSVNAERVWSVLLNKYSTGVICYAEKSLLRIAFASTPLAQIDKLFHNIYLACIDCVEP